MLNFLYLLRFRICGWLGHIWEADSAGEKCLTERCRRCGGEVYSFK
jgi:hypothetical protein